MDALDWWSRCTDGLDTTVGSGRHGDLAAHAQQVALSMLVLADPQTAGARRGHRSPLIDPEVASEQPRTVARGRVLTGAR
ncbi:hypothetical protein [Nonomuraea dietziae]|uniref:hypothetical protein n=1 Tax=Nonomuraea dietziae TaxID=65515 RepID=UPI0031DB81CE